MNAIPQYETLTLKLEAHIAWVELNRPNKANAMNAAMWGELESCFQWLDSEPEVRVVVLSGVGKHFCAGIDLELFADIAGQSDGDMDRARVSEKLRLTIRQLQRNLTAIEQCRKPVLAAIHNGCIGGGVDMVSCCDMRYCSSDASFSIKEIELGMTADVGTLQRLPHIVPQGIVRELAYTGRSIGAEEARAIGLVNQCYPDRETLMQEVGKVAATIASRSPLAVRGTKEMLLYTRDHSVADGLNYIATWNAGMLSSEDLMLSIEARGSGKPADYNN